MKKHIFLLFFLSVFILAGAKKPCPPLTVKEKAEIEMQVLKVWKEHNAAVNRMDLQAMISVFSQDNFISAYADGSSFENLKELENTVSRVMLEQRSGQQILDEKIKVLVLSADYVLLNQEFLFEITHENYQITL